MNEAWFCHSPGLKVVCPSTPRDAKGLLKAALRDPNPVLYYEVKELYRLREIAEELPGKDFTIPFGQASIRREGRDLTAITYGQNVYHCLHAADKLAEEGIEMEVIDLRTLVPLDEATIIESVKKTNRGIGRERSAEDVRFRWRSCGPHLRTELRAPRRAAASSYSFRHSRAVGQAARTQSAAIR